MSLANPVRSTAIRAVILEFLKQRFDSKVEKLEDNDPKRAELRLQFVPESWLDDAARRVGQIQAVTHSLKPIHPDAKGSSLFCEPDQLPTLQELGSHALGGHFDADVVGNAAALDVYKFLKLEHQGQSLLQMAVAADADLGAALHPDPATAQAWMKAFAGLAQARGKLSSHTQAKQVYWPVGANPHSDDSYHLLAPLFPTSLVHRVYQTLQDDRFSEAAKAAREARKAGVWHDRPVREYRDLAIQKLGGTKPQNISQLNSERRGDNCLLASLPPVWQSEDVKPLLNTDTLFKPFARRPEVRTLVKHLRGYLGLDPKNNLASRVHRDDIVEAVLDEFLQFSAELQTLEPGWAADPRCDLPTLHCAWLDPDDPGSPQVPELIDGMADAFGHWLNSQLREPLPMGDPEYLHWRGQAREAFKAAEREGAL